ncbi:hypothetical protein CRE_12180 [Caenorhabditis remanei]|uniref:Malectin domain-containing protein n=1 Tax=Caenorhabditis remanei TaxID=31234 RepID=E3N051_CAERE|nr:hypothetical protein CRE_12180 [Caenorhabditis remanei]
MSIILRCTLPLLITFFFVSSVTAAVNLRDRVVAAVNCGGGEALGAYGIEYSADYSDEGMTSDAGVQFAFNNAETDDLEVYQTERWSKESFDYEVPVGDGEYVIILKFSEVYFSKAGEKVFNVRINSHTAVKNLDIFDAAGGRGFAHEIYIPVVIKGKTITVQGHSRDYRGKIIIEFAKGPHDNPKVNGFVIVRGTVEDLPPPPERNIPEDAFPEDFEIDETDSNNDPHEESFNPKIIRGDDMEEEEEEMFSATTGSENPFEKKESITWLLPFAAAFIIIMPIAYVIALRFEKKQK